ncbi:MAG TPA: nickel pincer cofactor biosynthesis protein LarB [Candidatus Latescibacteria bacterium]|nr:1-(5-phosphoribosyl)-5-amino-4-imidazole-carboxylate carboxylase [Gemmatimonadota bacterium]HCR18219.1 nickel pincer cofactor biosynthesis protein LarB [Candidatus Latescibacterota bacterium]
MTPERIRQLLEGVKSGTLPVEDAMGQLERLPFEDLGFAQVDHHRAMRQGFPEVIFSEGKTVDQVVSIARRIVAADSTLLATRVSDEAAEALRVTFPEAEHNALARTIVVRADGDQEAKQNGTVLVISAGTSDLPVAEEAYVTAEVMGNRVEKLYDVGVAGIHRLLSYHDQISKASVIIVVAGMEGALASVVGGLVDVPVIAVPTSVGYGASFGGVAALLAMLNSCAKGVAVVNIDNGFGAGAFAGLVNRVGCSVKK